MPRPHPCEVAAETGPGPGSVASGVALRQSPSGRPAEAVPAFAGPVVVMGVAGCGKSSLAEALSRALDRSMIEGDAFHSDESRARMQAGIALTDADRGAWLVALGRALAAEPRGAILACSALKRSYRDILRAAAPDLRFVFLHICPADAQQRVAGRVDTHFFNPDLVHSQFDTLEPPQDDETDVLSLDATRSLSVLCKLAADGLLRNPPTPVAP